MKYHVCPLRGYVSASLMAATRLRATTFDPTCGFSIRIYWILAQIFQSRIALSKLPLASSEPLGLNATDWTAAVLSLIHI